MANLDVQQLPTFDTPVAVSPDAPVAPVAPSNPYFRRIPNSWAIAGFVAWVLGMQIAVAVEGPPPADLSLPFVVSNALLIANIASMVTLAGLLFRRRFALHASAVTAGFAISTTAYCAVHLGIGAVLLTQLAIVASLFSGSVYALTRS